MKKQTDITRTPIRFTKPSCFGVCTTCIECFECSVMYQCSEYTKFDDIIAVFGMGVTS